MGSLAGSCMNWADVRFLHSVHPSSHWQEAEEESEREGGGGGEAEGQPPAEESGTGGSHHGEVRTAIADRAEQVGSWR